MRIAVRIFDKGRQKAQKSTVASAVFFIAICMLLLPEMAEAQCSMCRAVTESNLKTDDAFTVGNGLNNAIVYLMFAPYTLAVIFAFAFFRKEIMAWFRKTFA